MRSTSPFLFVILVVFLSSTHVHAENIERDQCACKVAEIGASSSLHGGVCVRTEALHCLIEWDWKGEQSVPVGNGLPQTQAAPKALELIKEKFGSLNLELIGPGPDGSPLGTAFVNLATLPPEKYPVAIAQSYAVIVATALSRFDAPVGEIAVSLMKDPRFYITIQNKEAHEKLETIIPMIASYGCLQIQANIQSIPLFIYINTPFASTLSC